MKNLKSLRKAAKLTQKELSKKSTVATSKIALYESGDGNPTYETQAKLAAALGVNVRDLIG